MAAGWMSLPHYHLCRLCRRSVYRLGFFPPSCAVRYSRPNLFGHPDDSLWKESILEDAGWTALMLIFRSFGGPYLRIFLRRHCIGEMSMSKVNGLQAAHTSRVRTIVDFEIGKAQLSSVGWRPRRRLRHGTWAHNCVAAASYRVCYHLIIINNTKRYSGEACFVCM